VLLVHLPRTLKTRHALKKSLFNEKGTRANSPRAFSILRMD
jgi:hypothetical protein